MPNEFVSREEFNNLKLEVAEIKEEMSKNSEVLQSIDRTQTCSVFSNITMH